MSKYNKYKKEAFRIYKTKGTIAGTAKELNKRHPEYSWQGFRKWLRYGIKLGKNKPKLDAKILVFDIETSPLLSYTWGKWKQNINDCQLINDWFMITWSAKWLFDDKYLSDKLTPEEAIKQNDKRIVKSIFELIDKADIVIAHNGDKFDLRKLNTRFLFYELGTPSSYQSIDTLKHARKQLSVTSNRLDYLGKFFGLDRKIETGGFELWANCLRGDEKALKDMETYNIQDVKLLEDVYLFLRPYIKPHPNLALFIDDELKRCPTCGSDQLEWKSEYITTVSVYAEYKCKCCGSNSRERKKLSKNKHILSSLPR